MPSTTIEIVDVVGRMPYASNATLLGRDAEGGLWIYKPDRGESPLWDFPSQTLARREILAYELSEAMELHLVPPTFEADGLHGPGSAQLFLDEDTDFDPRPWFEGDLAESLWPFAVFDVVANNADRKVGHLLVERGSGRVWGIDNGLTFHVLQKLRTVLWGFAGQRIPSPLMDALERARVSVDGELGRRVERLLGRSESDALRHRIEVLIDAGVHPLPPADRPATPWPMW